MRDTRFLAIGSPVCLLLLQLHHLLLLIQLERFEAAGSCQLVFQNYLKDAEMLCAAVRHLIVYYIFVGIDRILKFLYVILLFLKLNTFSAVYSIVDCESGLFVNLVKFCNL